MVTKKSPINKTAKKKSARVKSSRKTAARKTSTRKTISKRSRPRLNPSKLHVYCGELFYPDLDEIINVNRFIVKGDQISFDLITTWDGERWSYVGISDLQPNGQYRSVNLVGVALAGSLQLRDCQSIPCMVTFRIEKQFERKVVIKGTWSERGDTFLIEGTLKRFVPPKATRVT